MGVAEHVALWQASLGTLNQLPLELNTYLYADSVGIPLTPNLNTYSYARDNPLRYVDPTGLSENSGSAATGPGLNASSSLSSACKQYRACEFACEVGCHSVTEEGGPEIAVPLCYATCEAACANLKEECEKAPSCEQQTTSP
ncbi:MAG: hypothetical protein ACYC9H_07135 [Sulfuricaulis sp.]